jgi:FtsH-binding integral membrane protein
MATSNSSGGVGFTGLLTIVFIVLKFTGYINWSWLWVLSPIWIMACLGLIVICIALILKG